MGGSESRFVMGLAKPYQAGKPTECLMAASPEYGTKITMGKRDEENRHQKFRVQQTSRGVYIRFDKHPQPCISCRPDHDDVELYSAETNLGAEWTFSVLQIQLNGIWVEPKETLKWDADHMSEVKRLRILCYNEAKKSFLTVDGSGDVKMLNIRFNDNGESLRDVTGLRNWNLIWEVDYVCSQWSAGEVGLAVVGPTAVAGLLGVAVLAESVLVGAALFEAFGFLAIPTMQFVGAGALSAAGTATLGLVSAFCLKVLKQDPAVITGK